MDAASRRDEEAVRAAIAARQRMPQAPQQPHINRQSLVDATAVFRALVAACEGQLTIPALAQRLTELDAFRGLGRDNAIAQYSRHILDALPKLFTAQHGGGETVGEQLLSKLAKHNLLLQILGDAGAFPRLHATVLRYLFEDGQRLQALIDIRELESKQQEQQPRAGSTGEGNSPLHEVIVAAGRACAAAVDGSGDRSAEEIFYACPTSTVAQFLKQVAAAAANAGRQPGQAAADFEGVKLLIKAVQVALGGALQQRAEQQQWFGPAINAAVAGLDEPEWTAGADVRAALQGLAEACCRLHPLLMLEAPQQAHSCVVQLSELTDRLLNACAAAVTAAPAGQQRLRLHREYAGVRERLLGQLLQQALVLSQQDEAEGVHQVRRIQGMAEAHAAYPQLYDIADATGERQELFQEMQQLHGDGLNPPFADYVFERLLREGRHAELMDLPQQLDAELQLFLSEEAGEDGPLRQQLRWLHEVRVGAWGGAASTLSSLSLQQQQEEEQNAVERQRIAALQKLAALAACPLWPLAMEGEAAGCVAEAEAVLEALEAQG